MLRTTDHHVETTPAPPVVHTGDDPLLRLQNETRTSSGPGATRSLSHLPELSLRGIPVICSTCRARRDWLLINHGRHVWICCRCSNQWLEPEITRADIDAMIDIPDSTTYPSVDQGLAALGFDGAFAGTYLD